MTKDERAVNAALTALEQQEQALTENVHKFQRQLAKVRAARASLTALVTDEPTEFEGKLADAIRTVLMASPQSYPPTVIRDMVKNIGYVFRDDQNQMAAVHGVLKRFKESDLVKTKRLKRAPDEVRYYWNAFAHLAHGPNALTEKGED